MAKISKNIKKLRTSANMSQETLAEKLFISRQAVSSWENDRTQPDIEMLEKLADVFNTSIEELIYGEKRKTILENEEPKRSNRMLIIIFSVLGAAFVGIGLVMLLIYGWSEFNLLIKSVLGILPMLIGQGVGVFAFFRKKDSTAWCEGASALWCIGIISTIALFNGIYEIELSSWTLCFIMMALLLPVIYLFNSVSPLLPYYFISVFSCCVSDGLWLGVFGCIFTIVAIIPVIILNRKKQNSFRQAYRTWITTLGIFAAVIACSVMTTQFTELWHQSSDFVLVFGFFTGLLAFSKKHSPAEPYYVLGSLGSLTTLIILCFYDSYMFGGIGDRVMSFSFWSVLLFKGYFALMFIVLGVFFGRNAFIKNYAKIIMLVTGVIGTIATLVTWDSFSVLAFILAMVQAVTYIVYGSINNKFYDLNLGLLALFVLMFRVLFVFDLNLIVTGVLFFVFGAALLVVNLIIIKKSKKAKLKTETGETTGGDLNE